MNNIVFIENRISKTEPFTTSEVIAEYTGIEHRKLKTVIHNHLNDFETLGLSTPYKAESTGGRRQIIYRLNEQQATFLITLLKNTPIVVAFKKELVHQFYLMREELMKRQKAHAELKPIRRELTDAIRDRPELDKWAYKSFTDLAYKTALGKTAAQLRKERGTNPKANASEYLTAAELEDISRVSNQIAVLIDLGLNYSEVKNMLPQSIKKALYS